MFAVSVFFLFYSKKMFSLSHNVLIFKIVFTNYKMVAFQKIFTFCQKNSRLNFFNYSLCRGLQFIFVGLPFLTRNLRNNSGYLLVLTGASLTPWFIVILRIQILCFLATVNFFRFALPIYHKKQLVGAASSSRLAIGSLGFDSSTPFPFLRFLTYECGAPAIWAGPAKLLVCEMPTACHSERPIFKFRINFF